MTRELRTELLDVLPPADPAARRSRCDLRRVNAWMRNAPLMARVLRNVAIHPPSRLVDLGAGDGAFLVSLARRLRPMGGSLDAILVDQHDVICPVALSQLQDQGWRSRPIRRDVFAWLESIEIRDHTWIVANLFLHHFQDQRLRDLLRLIRSKASVFCACEPRRARWPLFFSRLLWVLGANHVTRHDAVASVWAGFTGNELSRLWPADDGWTTREHRAGFFSHVFLAFRNGSDRACGEPQA